MKSNTNEKAGGQARSKNQLLTCVMAGAIGTTITLMLFDWMQHDIFAWRRLLPPMLVFLMGRGALAILENAGWLHYVGVTDKAKETK